jgi:hypothetical protein
MPKVLIRIGIPPRLRDEMMLKEAASFDIPATDAGIEFQQWWSRAPAVERDKLMKTAYANNISLLDALGRDEDD